MNYPVAVKMLDALTDLARDGGNLALGHDVCGDQVRKMATFHVLHDDPQGVFTQEGVDKINNVGMLGRAHDEDLVDNLGVLGLLVKTHLLDRNREIGANLVCGVHAARRTTSARLG